MKPSRLGYIDLGTYGFESGVVLAKLFVVHLGFTSDSIISDSTAQFIIENEEMEWIVLFNKKERPLMHYLVVACWGKMYKNHDGDKAYRPQHWTTTAFLDQGDISLQVNVEY